MTGRPRDAERAAGQWPLAVLFDLDGTLAASFGAITQALAAALEAEGLRPRPLAWVRRHVGRGAAALIRDAVPGANDECVERIRRRYLEIYAALPLEAAPPFAGAREVLEFAWRGTGGRVAVVSNKMAALSRQWLTHWGLDGFVRVVSGPDAVGALKPDPAAVLPVLAALGVAAADSLLVGDMAVDAATGAAAGLSVILVGASSAGEGDAAVRGRLRSVRELPRWLVHNGRGWQ